MRSSPKLKSDGSHNYFYDTMSDVEVGDVVLRYVHGKIAYFGIFFKEASSARKPDELGATGDV